MNGHSQTRFKQDLASTPQIRLGDDTDLLYAKFTNWNEYSTFVLTIVSWLERSSRFGKIIILLQTLLNMLLSLWIYEEYLHNRFFRTYLSSSLQGGSLAATVLVSTGALTIVSIVLFVKWFGYRRELGRILSVGNISPQRELLVNRLKNALSALSRKIRRS